LPPVWILGEELPGVLVSGRGAFVQPGQPWLQATPGLVIAEFCRQAHHPHVMLPGLPARQ